MITFPACQMTPCADRQARPGRRPIWAGFTRISAALLLLALAALPARAFDTKARAAFVIDISTRTILLAKDADEALPPASMSKLMTLYVAFEAIRDGRLQLDEKLPVSRHAMSYGGSTMFLDTTDKVRVEDLLRGIIVLSGNDACAVIAEALSPDGTEAGFANYMTQRAQQLGMTASTFANSNGWPAEGHRMSMRDLALLAAHLIEDFPQFYPMFAEREFAFDNRAPQNVHNRNPLLGLGIGADGLKTGHTSEAGYGLVGSAKQGDRRVVFALTGLDSPQSRAEESRSIVNWAFRQFAEKEVIKSGDIVLQAQVSMGQVNQVGLTPARDVSALLPVLAGSGLAAEVVYQSPLRAPVSAGTEVGELILRPEGLPEIRVPVVTADGVARGGIMVRMRAATQHLLNRLDSAPEASS
ncbi:D-alanyl-D-alanine carboxypeptidase family protein [Pseudooceanicola sp.]|uniref:D-alanyl-D-alanine carboxypeptidase family protein n=1 Tax=Pseudooceanicola sp. TaxID=1914328 RepID=UPI002621CB93|nr:D-alanyl-D-alanine carboxypeptidase family protein [Pseudooceanicola sp.]MDF1856285.1 D-alanyl-D-alanine carboxypeptidase [Pseudooceanicola sp.]